MSAPTPLGQFGDGSYLGASTPGGAGGAAFVQGGNAFGANAILGTLDGFYQSVITAGVERMRVDGVATPFTYIFTPLEQDEGPANKFVRVGTVDAFARRQIWHTETNSVLRLGADMADGDAFDADSEGIVVYHTSDDHLGRMKADRFGLTRASDSSLYYFRVDETALFYRANPPGGTVWFNVDRTTGLVSTTKQLVTAVADPAAGDAVVRLRGVAAQTGDMFRCESSAGVLLCTISIDGDVTNARDVIVGRDVLVPTGFVQVGPVPPIGAFGDVRVTEQFVGDAAVRVGFLADLQQTGGSDTGFVDGAFVRCSTLGNSDSFGMFGVQATTEHGGTGTINGTMDVFAASFGTNFDASPATPIGAMQTVQGFDSEPDMSSGLSASAVATVCYRARQPFGTDGTHTITTAFGLLVDNQGATGITVGIGVDVRRCTGAGSFSIGVRNAGNTTFPAQSPAPFGADINNLPNPDTTWFRLQATAPIDFTGIASGTDGQVIVICNISAFPITMRHLSGASAAGNRFILKAGLPQVLATNATIALIYDFQTGAWRQWPTL